MQNKIKIFLTEFIWLTISLGLTILLSLFLFGWTFLTGDSDLHLHDTYFVISRWFILTPLFLLVVFLLYVIKEKQKSFNRTLPNWLIVISGVTLIVLLTFLIQTFSKVMTGWTLYPPLSGLGNSKYPEITTNSIAKFIVNLLTVVQVIVLTILLYFTYCWGTQKRTKQKE